MLNRICLFIVFISGWSLPSVAQEQKSADVLTADNAHSTMRYRVENGTLFIEDTMGEKAIVENTVMSVYERNAVLYAALGADGVAVIPMTGDAAGQIQRVIPVSHGRVTSLMDIEGELWMKIDSTTAVRLYRSDAGAGPVAITPVVQSSLPRPENGPGVTPTGVSGHTSLVKYGIIATYPGKVTLDKGARDGVKAGDRFNVYRTGDVAGAGVDGFVGEQVVAVLVVEAVNENSCLARIWRGDRVFRADEVRKVQGRDEASLLYPRKFDGLAEVSTTVRPIINIGASGFGVLCDLSAAYWAPHFFVDFRIQPLGFGWTEGSKVVSNSMLLSGGYNGRAFAVGLGAGLTSVNGNLSEMMNSFGIGYTEAGDSSEGEPEWEQSTRHAFSLTQRVRLGAQEGLHISVNNTLLYYRAGRNDDNPTGFIYGGTTGRITWPLAMHTDMFVEGGGGVMGFGFGAIGVFTWLRGNGDAGSIGLSASAGAAGIWSEKRRQYATYTDSERVVISGPMFALGLNIRFAASRH